MTETQSLGNSLKSFRLHHGYTTQKALSEALGSKIWSRGKIANYESNLNEPPEAFYIAIDDLTGESFLEYHSVTQLHFVEELISSLETTNSLSDSQYTLLNYIRREVKHLVDENRLLTRRVNDLKRSENSKTEALSDLLKLNDQLKDEIATLIKRKSK